MRTFTLVKNPLVSDQRPWTDGNNLYRQLFDLTHVIKLLVDPLTMQIVEANPAACKFYGYSHEQLRSMTLRDITALPESDWNTNLSQFFTQQTWTVQTRHRLAGGDIRDVEVQAGFLTEDKTSYLYGIIQDITERKRLEAALRASEEQLRLITDSIQDVVSRIDREDHILYVSSSLRSVLGYDPGDIIGKSPLGFFHPDDWQRIDATQRLSIESGNLSMRGEQRMRHADGHYIDTETTGKFLFDDHGQFQGGIYVTRDITERKRLEAALRASEERLRLITENVQDVITQSDSSGRIIYANTSSRIVLGFAPEELIGKLAREFLHPDDWERLSDAQEMFLKSEGQVLIGEGRMRHATGHYINVETTFKLLYDEQHNFLGGIYVTRDITERKRLEAALRASEEQLRLITDNVQDIVTRGDAEDRILYANASSHTVLGLAPEELVGKFAREFYHPDDWPRLEAGLREYIRLGKPFIRGESRMRHADGHYIDIETIGKLLYDDHSNYVGGIYVTRDITERKRLETALRASEERLRLITNNMQDLVILANGNEEIIYVSPSISTVMGYDTTTIVGTTPVNALHPDDRERVLQTLQSSFLGHISDFTIEMRLRHTAGHYMDFETNCRILYDDQQNLLGTVFVARDITERKRLEASLHASQEHLRLVSDNIQDLILLTDTTRKSVYFSPSFMRVLGYSADFLYSSLPVDFIHPDDRPRLAVSLQKIVAGQETQITLELRLSHHNGHFISFEDIIRSVYAADGQLTGILHVLRDLTSRKKMEALLMEKEKLQTTLEKEHELGILKTRMMERISHEFRTPLSIVQASTESLLYYHNRLTTEQRRSKIEGMQTQIQRITSMLDKMGLVIRSTDTSAYYQRVPTDLSAMCRAITGELAVKINLPDKFILDLEDRVLVSMDQPTIRDSISHIMLNAVRFSQPAAPVTVQLKQLETAVELRIIDKGIGIPTNELPHIFEPFFRGSNVDERAGLGIGLTIARAAIEAHGGTINIESQLRHGTTIIITLPA